MAESIEILKASFMRVAKWMARIARWTLAGKAPLFKKELSELPREEMRDVGSGDLLASLDVSIGTHHLIASVVASNLAS